MVVSKGQSVKAGDILITFESTKQ
ncbi:MAG: hypothetical protein ACM3X1_04075 [Ignavibacteriales bacterium]